MSRKTSYPSFIVENGRPSQEGPPLRLEAARVGQAAEVEAVVREVAVAGVAAVVAGRGDQGVHQAAAVVVEEALADQALAEIVLPEEYLQARQW